MTRTSLPTPISPSGFALSAAATPPAAPAASAQAAGPTRTHALSLLGEPALPPDFPHWPWVNPDAPKGGELVLGGLGSLYGALVGAAVFTVAHHLLSEMSPLFWQFWIGAALVAVALAGKGGVLGLLAAPFRRRRA